MKTIKQLKNEFIQSKLIWGYSPKGISNPRLAIELSQKGGVGIVDLEGLDEKTIFNILKECTDNISKGNLWGVRLTDSSQVTILNKFENIPIVIIPNGFEVELLLGLSCDFKWLLAEVCSFSEAQQKIEWADLFLVKGFESGGWISDKSSFILIQEFNDAGYPFIIQGGIGVYNIISTLIGGALGVVLDEQLSLLPESPLSEETKTYLSVLDENDTYIIGESFDSKFRIVGKIANKWIREFKNFEKSITHENSNELYEKINEVLSNSLFLSDSDIKHAFLPFGIGLRFAKFILMKFGDLSSFLVGIRRIVNSQMFNLSINWAFEEGSELTKELNTKYPIIQGPMANVTDNVDFAIKVKEEGALPVLAFGGLLKEETEELYQIFNENYPKNETYAAGIIGLEVVKERRDEHISLIQKNNTPFCLLAAGSVQLASKIQNEGTSVIMHTPALSLFVDAIKNGIKFLILEGNECGGHIGTQTSMTLWETIIQYVEQEKENFTEKLNIIFAGGISDEKSTAMLAAMVSNHLEYISPGIQMGTAYLFTEEITETKALQSRYQELLLNSDETKVIGTTVNTRARAVPSTFVSKTLKLEFDRIREGKPIQERKELYEKDNLGALRIATKAEIWNTDHKPGTESTQFIPASKKIQDNNGCYMAGELISLKRNIVRIRDLHYDVIVLGKTFARQQIAEIENYFQKQDLIEESETEQLSLSIENRVAIVGLGCIFPDAFNADQFWQNIISKKYSITEVPKTRWSSELYFHEDKNVEDKTYSKIGSFIKDYKFNSVNYRIPPKIADKMDDVQKWAIDSAKQALEDAGIPTDGKARLPIAIIVGNSLGGENQRSSNKRLFVQEFIKDIQNNEIFQSLSAEKQRTLVCDLRENYYSKIPTITEDSMPGELSNVIAGRIANVFNLSGKSMTTDAACASSIAAIDTAVNSLLSREFNVALAGGADRSMDISTYVKFCKIGALSAEGSRPFDEKADGFVMGEGAGFVVLKRLEDAIKDGNKIYAVITAIGSSSDGKGKGITAPNPEGQKQAIEMAFKKADLDTNAIDYIEAHGTSTIVGDAVELKVLEDIFATRNKNEKVAVSSIKSQIGHLKSAAGIASVIKASLALYNKILPPSVNIDKLNPNINWTESNLSINTETKNWRIDNSEVGRVGVSAFGFGGTNYHAILEEYNPLKIKYQDKTIVSVPVSSQEMEQKEIVLQSIKPKLCYMFTGQGSQYLGMAKQLYENSDIVKGFFDKAEQIWYNYYSYNFKEIVFGSDKLSLESNKKRLTDTKFTQPAIFVVDVAIASLLAEEGIKADLLGGHSLGEYAALVVAGALSFEDGLRAVIERGKSMSRAGNSVPGAMAAILAPIEKVKEIVHEVKNNYITIANYNSKNQTVISGEIEGIEQVLEIAKTKGINAKRLSVSTAFHSKIVKSVEEEMEKVLSKIEFNSPLIPVYSNVNGKVYPSDPNQMRKLLVEQISSSVLWVDEIANLYNAGARYFVEIGPKKALYSFVNDILKDKGDINAYTTLLPKQDELNTVQTTLKQLQSFRTEVLTDISDVTSERIAEIDSDAFRKIYSGEDDFQAFLKYNSNYLENFLKSGYQLYSSYIEDKGETKRKIIEQNIQHQSIGVTGIGIGFPGKNRNVFDDGNIDAILAGENFIDSVVQELKQDMLSKNINRLVKSADGSASFEEIDDISKVINLAGQLGDFDPETDFGLDEKLIESLDITFQLAICAGLDALADAGIPLVKSSFTTSTGKVLEGKWELPESLQDETGIIFASAFPGYDNLIKEIQEYQALENDKQFSRNFLFKILSMGHSQFAQLIKAKGPNTQINAACASTTQAVGIAEDWIRTGRCNRVIVIAADDASSEHLLPWIGSGFLVAGGVTTEEEVQNAALPFGKNRHGLIIGAAAAALVLENEDSYKKRGTKPIVDLLGSSFVNSGFHGSRLDVSHISDVFQKFIERIEKEYNIPREELARDGIFVSHETYTPARGGSAESEIEALRRVFGKDANKITIVNTKGFTGHAMGAGLEECVAIKAMEKGKIPPIANFDKIDPLFSDLKFSKGEDRRVKYAIRLAAGFGSQVAFTAFRLNTYEDRFDVILHEEWLNQLGGSIASIFQDGRVLKMNITHKIPETTEIISQIPSTKPVTSTEILSSVISIISETTGYEPNLVEAEMHLEEDLGIDTVKQAEIFGILREKWNLSLDDSLSLAEFTTPLKIAEYIQMNAQNVKISTSASTKTTSSNKSDLANKIREVISETTGYDQDLIEFDMDLEEDLGIDTIKQAEIFGDIREIFDLPIDDTVSLAEFRTITDITNYVVETIGDNQQIEVISDEKSVEKTEVKEEEQDEDSVRVDRLITLPKPLDKHIAEKIKIKETSALIININSSLQKELSAELENKFASIKSFDLLKEQISTFEGNQFGFYIVLVPDFREKQGQEDQEIYRQLFSLFQQLELDTNKKILAISNENFFGHIDSANPISGGISGFIKTLGIEFEMKYKHVYSDKVPEIVQELEFWDDSSEIAYYKKNRFALSNLNISKSLTQSSKIDIKENDLLLVSGGGRGITYKCLESLSSIIKPKVAILGLEDISEITPEMLIWSESDLVRRKEELIEQMKETEEKLTPVLIEKQWSKFLFNLEVYRNLEKLRKMKIQVEYRSVDVTKKEAVENAIKDVEKHFNTSITHIVHGAGLEESKSFKKKNIDFSNLIVAVKVQGIWNILNSINMNKLKRVICFTSIAGRYGNRGQVDYSFANGYLARLCWMLNQKGISSLACDWSAWGGVGMATRGSIMDILTSQGIHPISLEQGTDIFVRLFLNTIGSEVIVSCGLGPFEQMNEVKAKLNENQYPMLESYEYANSEFQVKKTLSVTTDLYLRDHQIQQTPIFPAVMGIEMFAECIDFINKTKPTAFSDLEFNTALKIHPDKSKEIKVLYKPETEELFLKSEFVAKIVPSNKREIEHFKGKVAHITKTNKSKPTSSEIRDSNIDLLSKEDIYSFFFHGKSFQVLECLKELNGSQAITKIKLSKSKLFSNTKNKTLLNPLAIEAALQTSGLYDYIVNNKTSLPSRIDYLKIYNTKKPKYIVSKFREITNTHSIFDVEVLDQSSKIILSISGLSMIHTQFSFNETSKLQEKLESTLQYWNISNSLSSENFRIIPVSVVSTFSQGDKSIISAYLTENEKTKYDEIKNPKRKTEYLSGIIASKELYSKLQNKSFKLKNIEIRKEKKGQPYFFDLKSKKRSDLHLSITHSGDFAIAAIDKTPIGVDLEQIEERSESFYKEAFTEKERNEISLNAEKGTIYWTIKEAITKALGEGLHLNLHDIEISENQEKSSYTIGFSSKIAETVPYSPEEFEITNKSFQNYTISYCQIKKEETK